MTVAVGVAGVAGMGLFHHLALTRNVEVRLAAICDVSSKALEDAARAAPDAKTFTDFGEMCRSGLIEAVFVATPNSFHADNVRTALDAGLHVYCEKPLGVTVGECRDIADRARAAGRRVQVGFQHRFQHGYATAKRLIDQGRLGTLRRADLRATDWFRPNSYFALRPWRGLWREAGGGVLMLQAIHQLDAFLWLAGMPTQVFARAWRRRPDIEIEDDIEAFLDFPGDCHGTLSASTVDPRGVNRVELAGDLGLIRAEGERLRFIGWTDPTPTMLVERTNPFEPVAVTSEDPEPTGDAMSFDECVVACHRDFIDAIATGREPLNNADEATKSVEVANAVYLSALTGEPVDLPLDAATYDDAFKRMCAGELSLR